MVDLIGYLAAGCTTISFLPQAYMVYKKDSTEGISLYMFLILCTGLSGWLIYGILMNAMPVIMANAFTLMLAGYILFKKLRHQNKQITQRN
jgi:MtN3 and saliva related transmembrane protein